MGKLMLMSDATEPLKLRIDYDRIIEVFDALGYANFDEYKYPGTHAGYTTGTVIDPNTSKLTYGVIRGIARISDEEYTVMTIDEFIKMYP